jgi:hypothetical protein
MKKQIDDMKFNATPDKIADLLLSVEEFYRLKHISKVQIDVKLTKKRQLTASSTEK